MNSPGFGSGDASRSGAAAAKAPTVCPACRSSSIATSARNPDANAYWRCTTCGEVWNAARRGTAPGGAR